MKVPCVVVDVKFNPDGTRVAAGCADSTAHVLDVSTGQELFVLPGFYVGFSPDGRYLFTQTADGMTHGFYLDVNDLISTGSDSACFAPGLLMNARNTCIRRPARLRRRISPPARKSKINNLKSKIL